MSFISGGSHPWMSPELLDHDDAYEHRPTKESDIYALGMLIYEVRTCNCFLDTATATPPLLWQKTQKTGIRFYVGEPRMTTS